LKVHLAPLAGGEKVGREEKRKAGKAPNTPSLEERERYTLFRRSGKKRNTTEEGGKKEGLSSVLHGGKGEGITHYGRGEKKQPEIRYRINLTSKREEEAPKEKKN